MALESKNGHGFCALPDLSCGPAMNSTSADGYVTRSGVCAFAARCVPALIKMKRVMMEIKE
jgi:hypothetical protein